MASETYQYDVKIPKERIAVLIGKNGQEKRDIEKLLSIKIEIDSHEGDVEVSGTDPITLYTARDVIRAIARGFNPEIAKLLVKQDYALDVISIIHFAKTKNDEIRLKGRVIGDEGKSRRVIEDLTETNISVYGKTIAIVGRIDHVPNARKAIELLLNGSPHSNVYHWLEKRRKVLARQNIDQF